MQTKIKMFHLTVKKEIMKSGRPKKRMIEQSYQNTKHNQEIKTGNDRRIMFFKETCFQNQNMFKRLNLRQGETMIIKSGKHDKLPEKGNDDPQ